MHQLIWDPIFQALKLLCQHCSVLKSFPTEAPVLNTLSYTQKIKMLAETIGFSCLCGHSASHVAKVLKPQV